MMKMPEIKSGYIVTIVDSTLKNEVYNVLVILKDNQLVCVSHDHFFPLSSMRKHLSIVKIFIPNNVGISCFMEKRHVCNMNLIWEKQTHSIIIDGKTIELSEESFQSLKAQFID